MIGEAQTLEKTIFSGEVLVSVEIEKGNLWLLLQWQALQWRVSLQEFDSSSLNDNTICLRIRGEEWPSLWCHSDEVVLMDEKESNSDVWMSLGHSYTPFLLWPCKRISPVCRSFTKKDVGKNSIDVLFELQTCEMDIKFLFMAGTQRTLGKKNVCEGMKRVVEPIWVMERPMPSLMTMSSVLSYD